MWTGVPSGFGGEPVGAGAALDGTTGSGTTPADHRVGPGRDERSTETRAGRYGDRELSWLDFNARVLALAEDADLPLLERLRFLAIFAANLDGFYLVRVAALLGRRTTGRSASVPSPDGVSTRELLRRVRARARRLAERHARCFAADVRPALHREGIHVTGWAQLGRTERSRVDSYFRELVLPALAAPTGDPAESLSHADRPSLHLAVALRGGVGGRPRLVTVTLPDTLPRLVAVAADTAGGTAFLPLEDLVAANLHRLLPGGAVLGHHTFRVTRGAEIRLPDGGNLLRALEQGLIDRARGPVVRLEVDGAAPPHLLDPLLPALGVEPTDVVRVPGPLGLAGLAALYEVDRPDLRFPRLVPAVRPAQSQGEPAVDVFAELRRGDVLVHHPYDSFAGSVQRLVEQAAADPDVVAIGQTLYRTGSPVVDALANAGRAGKRVVVLVEVRARFDERANLGWARVLERAGCRVVPGLPGLTTHGKVTLVVRREAGGLRRYCHVGTGNYNPTTARSYEDLGLLTADPAVCADIAALFGVLTGQSRRPPYRTLLVSPHGVRHGVVERVEREIANAGQGRSARIRIKVNALVDPAVVDALYRASQAGVEVDLLVRGSCVLRPGVPGLSDRIRVRSVVGRFLEHSRVFGFHNDGAPEYWLGSSDLVPRNLDRRIEVLVRVGSADARAYLSALLDRAFSDDVRCWELSPGGTWAPTRGTTDYQAGLAAALHAVRRR